MAHGLWSPNREGIVGGYSSAGGESLFGTGAKVTRLVRKKSSGSYCSQCSLYRGRQMICLSVSQLLSKWPIGLHHGPGCIVLSVTFAKMSSPGSIQPEAVKQYKQAVKPNVETRGSCLLSCHLGSREELAPQKLLVFYLHITDWTLSLALVHSPKLPMT